MSTSLPTASSAASFADLLRFWRQRRGYSQLSLALAAGVSQRHVSFIEGQRASPSRALILRLARVLQVPPRHRDQMLVAAGFAAMPVARQGSEPVAAIEKAVRLILQRHEPYPAIVLDRFWNITHATEGWDRLVQAGVGADTLARLRDAQGRLNLMRLVLEPDGMRPLIENWDKVGPYLAHRIEEDLELRLIDEEAQAAFAAIEPLLPDAGTRPGRAVGGLADAARRAASRRLANFAVLDHHSARHRPRCGHSRNANRGLLPGGQGIGGPAAEDREPCRRRIAWQPEEIGYTSGLRRFSSVG